MRGKLACLATLSLLLAISGTGHAALISNGSFEAGVDPVSFTTLTQGTGSATNITDWTVTSGTIDYIGTYWQAADGNRSIDLSGNNAGTVAVSQNINTVAGQTYYLSFDLAGNPDGGPAVKTVSVTLATPATFQTFTFNATGHTHSAMGWTTEGLYFTANSANTTLSFQSLTGTAYGPAIDNVSLVAVPEPATMAMSGTALLVVAGVVLRRRKATIA
jgi:choice-of-anchor C domain-containing protein